MFWATILEWMDTQMTTPTPYGWFHLLFFALSIAAGVVLCLLFKDCERYATRVVFITGVVVVLLEAYKLVNYTFSYEGGVVSGDFPWYVFPWQFCSTPMYAGLLVGLFRRGRIHRALCAYLGSFALFAGLSVMCYPNTVFIGTVGVNIQTMICHGSMISVGIYLLGTGYVPCHGKTLLRAVPVFGFVVAVAAVLNEVAYATGLLETDSFNMFFISPHQDPHLPVYSLVQQHVAFPWCLIVYVMGFTAAAGLVLLAAWGIRKAVTALSRRPAAQPL